MKTGQLIIIALFSLVVMQSCERKNANENNILGTWRIIDIDYREQRKQRSDDVIEETTRIITFDDSTYNSSFTILDKDFDNNVESTSLITETFQANFEITFEEHNVACLYMSRILDEYGEITVDISDDCQHRWDFRTRTFILKSKLDAWLPTDAQGDKKGEQTIDYLSDDIMYTSFGIKQGRDNIDWIIDNYDKEYYNLECKIKYERIE